MSTMPYIKMGKNMRGESYFWIYDGDSKSGIPIPTKKNPIRIERVIFSQKKKTNTKSNET